MYVAGCPGFFAPSPYGPAEPIPEQSCRELTPADTSPRAPDAAVQVGRPGSALSVGSRADLRPLPPAPSSDGRECLPGGMRGRVPGVAGGDMFPGGWVKAALTPCPAF